MGAYCVLIPQVRSTETGELVPSKLFMDLESIVGRKRAREIYIKVRSKEFQEEHSSELELDDNGEYTINSLQTVDELSDMFSPGVIKGKAVKDSNSYQPKPATRETTAEAEQNAINYNAKPQRRFIALPEIYSDNEGNDIVQVHLVPNTAENREEAVKLEKSQAMYKELKNIFSRLGIEETFIYPFLNRLRERGLNNYYASLSLLKNLQALAKQANGIEAEISMPNELAELIYFVNNENPLIDRLKNTIRDKNLLPEIFSTEELEELIVLYGKNMDYILESAVIQLISGNILKNDMLPENLSGLRNLLTKLSDVITEFSLQLNLRELESYIYTAEKTKADDSIKPADADIEEWTLNQKEAEQKKDKLSKIVAQQKKLLHDIIEVNVRRAKILKKKDVDYDLEGEADLTNTLYINFQSKEYELGVYNFIESVLEQLEKTNVKLQELESNTSLSLEQKATKLKAIKDFIQSYKISIDAIKQAGFSGVIQPTEQINTVINDATFLIGNILARYEAQKKPLLISFVQRFIGENFEVPFGKDKGKKITAEELLAAADKDITVFDRWLDAMAESGDMLLRILDQSSKQAKSKARLETLQYKKRLEAAYNKLKASGITDTSFMFEKDALGKKTGRYISSAQHLDKARKEYYTEVIEIKKELDAKLPKNATTLYNIIRVRKDYVERLKSQDSINGVFAATKEALRDKVKRRSDNIEAGGSIETEKKNILLDFSGRQVETLPIMFVNSKDGENIEDLSEDVTSTFLMYANMACNFSAMNNVVGVLELMREQISERPVQQRAGTKPLINVLKAFGLTVETKLTKSGESTNIVKRMNDWFSSQVYSRYMKEEGEIFGFDIGMLANASNELTALNQFALNILSGISNVMTASAMNRIESICGQFFSMKDLAKADTIFWRALPEYLAEVGNPVKTSKLALFMEKFNVMQDFESDIRGKNYGRSKLLHLLNTNSLYVINNAGELWVQNRAALALSESCGLKDENGKAISLWDSQEVVIDKNGVAKLVTKPGIRTAQDTAFNDDVDVMKFTNKAKSINQRMNGIYNYEDRCAAQAYAWGRIGLMFRKWIKPSLNRRYGNLKYNFDVAEWEEGFYRTTGRFFSQLTKDLKRGQLDIVTSYKNLDPREKANIMRFAVEVGQFLAVCCAFAVLKTIKKNADDDGEEEIAKSWWFNQLLYQTRRLESEIGAQMIINPQMIQEAFNIIKSPAACVNTWEGISNMSQLLVPSNYTHTLQTGRYKGHTKAYKLFWDSPIIPMHRTVYRGLHPENSLAFYDI